LLNFQRKEKYRGQPREAPGGDQMSKEKENEEPAGSAPVNPIQEPDNTPSELEAKEEANAEGESKAADTPNPHDARIAALEKMLSDSQGMIGKQSTEVGSLRKELESLRKPAEPAGPTLEEQIDAISDQMENGDIGLKEGNRMIAKISAQMAEKSTVSKFQEQRKEEQLVSMQQKFLGDNPDFEEVRDNGTLDQIMAQDPMADVYTAYRIYKAGQEIESIKTGYEQKLSEVAAKIPQAKEEGAKLAQGAAEAGKVLGKNGTAARSAAETIKPFKSTQDAHDAMLATLQGMRGAK